MSVTTAEVESVVEGDVGEGVLGVSKDHRGGLDPLRGPARGVCAGCASVSEAETATAAVAGGRDVSTGEGVTEEVDGLRRSGTETASCGCSVDEGAFESIFGDTGSANLTLDAALSLSLALFAPGGTRTPLLGGATAARSCAGALHPGPDLALGVTPGSLPPFALA